MFFSILFPFFFLFPCHSCLFFCRNAIISTSGGCESRPDRVISSDASCARSVCHRQQKEARPPTRSSDLTCTGENSKTLAPWAEKKKGAEARVTLLTVSGHSEKQTRHRRRPQKCCRKRAPCRHTLVANTPTPPPLLFFFQQANVRKEKKKKVLHAYVDNGYREAAQKQPPCGHSRCCKQKKTACTNVCHSTRRLTRAISKRKTHCIIYPQMENS